MKKLIGSILVALTLVLSVFGLAACDLVNFNWGSGSDHEHHFIVHEATDPTCTEDGNVLYYKCETGPNPCERCYTDLAAMVPVPEEDVILPALGHQYDFDHIEWSEWNGKEITASVTCQREGCSDEEEGHVLNPKIDLKGEVTKPATCTEKGETTYTASFTYDGVTYTCPKRATVQDVETTPHNYGDPTWTWKDHEATATFTCKNQNDNTSEPVVKEATVTHEDTKPATCIEEGVKTYTATVEFNGKTYTSTDEATEVIPKIPHTYGEPTWEWEDDYSAATATFKCTTNGCTETKTVTVTADETANGKIEESVETIEGACKDGSETTYTATVNFNEKPYTSSKVVRVDPVEKHTPGEWQYNATQHWHKCSVCGEDMDDKASHQVDPATHKCVCGYVEESYTVTALTLAANAENTAAILTISGTYTGYDQQGLTELFCEKNTDGNYFFNFWGNGIGRENAKSVTLTKWENGEFSVALDVTDLPVCELRNICRTDLGTQDWKLSTETIEETTITVGEKVYTLQPSNGYDWNNLGLKVESKTVEKTYAITDASIAAEGEAVYVTVSGTFDGYTKEEFKAALKDDNRSELAFKVQLAGSPWTKQDVTITYDVQDGTFEVKFDVTELPVVNDYSFCQTDTGDIKPGQDTALNFEYGATTAETAAKIYTLSTNGDGNLSLAIKTKQAEVDGTFDLTTVTLEVDETAVYVVYKGTHTCKDTAALQAKFEAEAFGIWVGKLIPEANRTVTVEATTWTIKANVSSMNLADGTHFIYFNGGSGAGDINTFPLEAIPNITKTFGEKDYSIENHYGGGRDDFWGCVILRIAPTKEVSTYDFTDVTIEKTDSAVYFVASGSHNYTNTEELKTALNAIKFAFGDKTDNTELEKKIEVTDGSWSIKFNVTELAAQANPYYFHFFYSDDPEGDVRLKNEHAEDGKFVELAGKKYSIVNKGNGVNTWANETFWGCVCLKVETAKTATFGIANLQNDGGVRVLLRITATGFEADDLKPENIELSIDETNKVNAYLKTGDNEYYFYVKDFTTGGNLKVTIGGVEFTKNLASEVAADQNKQFVNPNFYTLALNGDDLVLTVINAAEAFTLNGISLKNTAGTVNLTLTGTTTAADATAKLFLENYGYCYYKNGRQQFANKTVTVEGGKFTFTVDVTDLGAGSYTLLARDADGTDLTNGDISLESITDKEATKDSIRYSIVNVEGTKLALLIEDSAHETSYNKLSLKATADTLYLVIEGTYSGYSIEDIKAVLENTDGAKEPYSFSIYDGFGKNFPREATVTPSKDGATDGTWKLEINITTFQKAGVNHILERDAGGGDLRVKEGKPEFDPTVVEFKNLNYSLVLDGEVLSVSIVETSYTEPDSKDSHTFGEPVQADMEKELLQGAKKKGKYDAYGSDTSPDTWIYWYVAEAWDNCGTVVTMSATPTIAEGKLTFTYKGGSLDWSVQLFYNNSNLTVGKQYYLSMILNSSVESRIKINGKAHNLKAGENQIGVIFTLGGPSGEIDAIDIQFPGTDYAAGGIKGGEITYTLSNVAWEEVDPASVGPVDPEVPPAEGEVKVIEIVEASEYAEGGFVSITVSAGDFALLGDKQTALCDKVVINDSYTGVHNANIGYESVGSVANGGRINVQLPPNNSGTTTFTMVFYKGDKIVAKIVYTREG